MTHPLRIRQLEALIAVTHHGSMTRGAQELGISQPAVSRLLSDLREVLGFNLFNRRDGRLVPTQEVRYLLPDIRRVLDMMHQITEVSQNITDKKAGHLSIACLPGFATSHLPEVVAGFLKDRPGVSVTLEPDRPERILEWMVGEQFDFGITDGFEGHPAVESEHVDIRTVCVFPSGHRLAALDEVSPNDLVAESFIHTRRDSTFFRALNEAFQKESVSLNSLVETRQFTAACELVCNGVGVSVVSELDAAKYDGRGLDYRPFTPRIAHRLSLVRPILKQPSLITLEFMETFTDSLSYFKI